MRLSGWAGQRERGSAPLVRLMLWIARHLGWHAGQALLYPITLYFLLTAPRARAASRDYLRRALGRKPGWRDVARHFFTFACAILDRVFLLTGQDRGFRLEAEGVEALRAVLEEGRGCILLGAHLGSFEVLRVFARQAPVGFRAVMFRGHAGAATRLLERLDPALAARVIDIGAPDAMLRVRESLAGGEMVGFLGDRMTGQDRSLAVPFLGAEARFPAGPLLIASLLEAPVVLFHAVRLGPRRYAVRFEMLAHRIRIGRASREADLRHWLGVYAARLGAACRAHPFNWFNFYPFWQETPAPPRTRRMLLLAGLCAAAPLLAAAMEAPLLDRVMALLAARPSQRATFQEEKTLASLSTPLHSHGTLLYVRPGYLEKRTLGPQPERLVLDGSRLWIATGGQTARVVDLDAHPGLRALADTFVDVLSGNAAALRRSYAVQTSGTLASWRITLRPLGPRAARFLRSAVIEGSGAQLRVVAFVQANGDEDRMTITP